MRDTREVDYAAGLEEAYVGELSAERLYRALAQHATDPLEQEKFATVANIERLTSHTLAPVAHRLGIRVEEAALEARARERFRTLSRLTFPAFIAQAAEHWPPYIARFEHLAGLAPAQDADVMRLLVAHERALVRFIELEQASPAERASLEPLRSLLALMPRPPGAAH